MLIEAVERLKAGVPREAERRLLRVEGDGLLGGRLRLLQLLLMASVVGKMSSRQRRRQRQLVFLAAELGLQLTFLLSVVQVGGVSLGQMAPVVDLSFGLDRAQRVGPGKDSGRVLGAVQLGSVVTGSSVFEYFILEVKNAAMSLG